MASSDTARPSRKRPAALKGSLAAGLLLAGAVSAQAQSFTYDSGVVRPSFTPVARFTATTQTGVSPTFNRVGIALGGLTLPPVAPSGSGTAVAYALNPFVPTTAATYVVSNTVTGYGTNTSGTSNFVQFLYNPAFVPTSATTNFVLGDNPIDGTGSTYDAYAVDLTAGSVNTFVNTGRFNATAANDANSTTKSTGTSTTTISQFNPGSTQNIPSDNAGEVTFVANVTGSNIIGAFNTVTLEGLQAGQTGGIVCTLTHNGTTVIIMDKPGADNNPNDPNYNYGQGSLASFGNANVIPDASGGSIGGASDYTFAKSGADLSAVPDPGASSTGASFVPSNTTYKATPNPNGSGSFSPFNQNTLSAFNGMDAQGAWYLDITDTSIVDTASLQGFSFNFTAAPEPSQWASFGLGALALGGLALRARRRSSQEAA